MATEEKNADAKGAVTKTNSKVRGEEQRTSPEDDTSSETSDEAPSVPDEELAQEAAPAAPVPNSAPVSSMATGGAPPRSGQPGTEPQDPNQPKEAWEYLKKDTFGSGNFFDFNSF